MKKPVEAIERMRETWDGFVMQGDAKEIIDYLDSIPEWPADLTPERLKDEANFIERTNKPNTIVCSSAAALLRRLAELAPRKEKRKVELYEFLGHGDSRVAFKEVIVFDADNMHKPTGFPWRRVGEAEIDA